MNYNSENMKYPNHTEAAGGRTYGAPSLKSCSVRIEQGYATSLENPELQPEEEW